MGSVEVAALNFVGRDSYDGATGAGRAEVGYSSLPPRD